MTEQPQPDDFVAPVLPPTPMPFDLAGELFALHQERMRRLDKARAERLALAQARAAGLVTRHETKLSRIEEQRALAAVLGLSTADPDKGGDHDGCEPDCHEQGTGS